MADFDSVQCQPIDIFKWYKRGEESEIERAEIKSAYLFSASLSTNASAYQSDSEYGEDVEEKTL